MSHKKVKVVRRWENVCTSVCQWCNGTGYSAHIGEICSTCKGQGGKFSRRLIEVSRTETTEE